MYDTHILRPNMKRWNNFWNNSSNSWMVFTLHKQIIM